MRRAYDSSSCFYKSTSMKPCYYSIWNSLDSRYQRSASRTWFPEARAGQRWGRPGDPEELTRTARNTAILGRGELRAGQRRNRNSSGTMPHVFLKVSAQAGRGPRCRCRPSAPQRRCGVAATPAGMVGTAAARRRPRRQRPTRGSRHPRAPPAGCGPRSPRPPAASLAEAGVSQRNPGQSRGADSARPGRRSQ